jgi:hypothetical protein
MIELYDRKIDPEEMKNLARTGNYSRIIRKIDKRLMERIAEANRKQL